MKTKIFLAALLILFMLSSPSIAFAFECDNPDKCIEKKNITEVIPIQYYSPSTGEIVCWDACWHEVGHKLDYEVMDKISRSDEFQNEVINFLYVQLMYTNGTRHPMTTQIFLFPGFFTDWYIFEENTGDWADYRWGGYSELYADILDWSQGDINKIPENLRQFYDMDAATQMYLDLDYFKGEVHDNY